MTWWVLEIWSNSTYSLTSSTTGKVCPNRSNGKTVTQFSALIFGGQLENAPGPNRSKYIGCIDTQCDVVSVIQDAYENARFLCDQYYLASPDLIINQGQHNGNFLLRLFFSHHWTFGFQTCKRRSPLTLFTCPRIYITCCLNCSRTRCGQLWSTTTPATSFHQSQSPCPKGKRTFA